MMPKSCGLISRINVWGQNQQNMLDLLSEGEKKKKNVLFHSVRNRLERLDFFFKWKITGKYLYTNFKKVYF